MSMGVDRIDMLDKLCRIKKEVFDYGNSEHLDDVIELYEKAVPKHVILCSTTHPEDYFEPNLYIDTKILCPNCREIIGLLKFDVRRFLYITRTTDRREAVSYCPYCGQKVTFGSMKIIPEVEFDNEVDTR